MLRSEKVEPSVTTLADSCLGYLAENPDELLAFMQFAGLDPDALRRSVGAPAFQRGLIDYFASNEPILLALCANTGTSPEEFMRVWYRLNPAG
ncbi:DUF3572 family protein [Devosia epidermidihirudinis]|uniref:DUF3572 family protein n=1 Tax=Devosia epidermidihirudinis TaxID=1293439 RepID=UPI0006978A4F|nr:DUF3572 family protein [Devosia epidermidihirudinis]